MRAAFYGPLGDRTVPPAQRHFATADELPEYAPRIAELRARGAELAVVYGIGRVCHVAFWEPHFAAEYPDIQTWRSRTHKLGAALHPLTVEQNALTSFRSRTTLVPAFANTVGPGLFLAADRALGGADGTLGRGMQWQGQSLWMTLRYGPDPCSAVWLARLTGGQEVVGSNPAAPIAMQFPTNSPGWVVPPTLSAQ